MAVPLITIYGTLLDVFGALVNGGSLVVQLVGFGAITPRVAGTSLVARTAPQNVDCPLGVFNFQLWGNDVITPAGSYYTITLRDDQENVVQTLAYQFAGVMNVDLSTVAPYNPPNPPIVAQNPVLQNPPGAGTQTITGSLHITGDLQVDGIFGGLGIAVVAFANNAVFNASAGIAFQMTLTGNLGAPTFINGRPGATYVFRFIQDGVGGRVVTWPVNVTGGGALDLTPGAISQQAFLCLGDGSLVAIGPMLSF